MIITKKLIRFKLYDEKYNFNNNNFNIKLM